MSDRFPAKISIGGKIKRRDVVSLCDQITEAGVCSGWDGDTVECSPASEAELLRIAPSGYIELYDVDARYGQFEDLEQFLTQHDISFDRHSEAKYEYNAEMVNFRSGMKEPVVLPSNQEGSETFVAVYDLRDVMTYLEAGNWIMARETLKRLMGDVPPLEKLEITD